MAINEIVRDIENYPTKSKTVSLDLQKVVPIDTEGDEVYVLNSAPAAGVTKIGGGTFNPLYIREFKAGYARSSGRVSAPFNITVANCTLQVSIDGSAFRTVILAAGNGLSGEIISDDLQAKINALAGTGQVEAGNLAFLNATAEFKNNKFTIIAGSLSNTFVGTGKSSVKVSAGLTNDASVTLGFNMYVNSEDLASLRAVETVLTATYSGGSGGVVLAVESTTDLAAGQPFMITNGTSKEYFLASGVSVGQIGIVGSGLINTYPSGSIIQKLFERDPNAELASPYVTIDDITRYSLRAIANQIDFSV